MINVKKTHEINYGFGGFPIRSFKEPENFVGVLLRGGVLEKNSLTPLSAS